MLGGGLGIRLRKVLTVMVFDIKEQVFNRHPSVLSFILAACMQMPSLLACSLQTMTPMRRGGCVGSKGAGMRAAVVGTQGV